MRLEMAMADGGNEPTPITDSPKNTFAAQIAALTPESVANPNNPLGLEPSELAAATRAKEAAAAAKRAADPGIIAAQAGIADARANAEATAKLIGGTVDANGMVVMPNTTTSTTTKKLSTNEKNAATIATYAAVHPAGEHQHYGTTLNPDGTPRLYWDTGWGPNGATGGAAPVAGSGSGSGSSSGSGSGSVSGSGSGANAANLTLVSTGTDPATNATIGYFSDGSSKVLTPGSMSQIETDAYSLLQDTFHNYGLDSLVPVIKSYMQQNLGSQQAALQLKQTKEYQTRFAGNTARLAAGMNALTESEYLALENSYNSTLQAYGLNGFFGTSRDQEISGMAKVIGGGVNAAEFTNRVSTVVDRVMNADPNIKKTLTSFYNITDADLVKYYLDPSKDNLAALNLKTTAVEIGTAATEQGLTTGVTSATALAQAGVTGAQAQKGYATIGQIVPETQKLSSIYGEAKVGYDQAAAEAEVFGTTGAASAARKRKQLADLETQAFQGRSGIQQQVNPLGKGLQGSF
jgi:hypothetical protein